MALDLYTHSIVWLSRSHQTSLAEVSLYTTTTRCYSTFCDRTSITQVVCYGSGTLANFPDVTRDGDLLEFANKMNNAFCIGVTDLYSTLGIPYQTFVEEPSESITSLLLTMALTTYSCYDISLYIEYNAGDIIEAFEGITMYLTNNPHFILNYGPISQNVLHLNNEFITINSLPLEYLNLPLFPDISPQQPLLGSINSVFQYSSLLARLYPIVKPNFPMLIHNTNAAPGAIVCSNLANYMDTSHPPLGLPTIPCILKGVTALYADLQCTQSTPSSYVFWCGVKSVSSIATLTTTMDQVLERQIQLLTLMEKNVPSEQVSLKLNALFGGVNADLLNIYATIAEIATKIKDHVNMLPSNSVQNLKWIHVSLYCFEAGNECFNMHCFNKGIVPVAQGTPIHFDFPYDGSDHHIVSGHVHFCQHIDPITVHLNELLFALTKGFSEVIVRNTDPAVNTPSDCSSWAGVWSHSIIPLSVLPSSCIAYALDIYNEYY